MSGTAYPTDRPLPVLLTKHPTIDSCCALWTLLHAHGRKLAGIKLYFSADDPNLPGELEDLDLVMRYREAGESSATAVVAKDVGLDCLPGMPELLAMLEDNNGMGTHGKGGYLKSFKGSFAWLARMVEDIQMPGRTREQMVLHWLERFLHVVETYFLMETPGASYLKKYNVESFSRALPELAAELKLEQTDLDKREASFTLKGYLAARYATMTDMEWLAGGAQRLSAEYRFWKEAFDKAAAIKEKAGERAEEIFQALNGSKGPHRFFDTAVGRAATIFTDNEKVGAKLFRILAENRRQVVLLMFRKKNGNTAILTRGVDVDLAGLAAELKEAEGDIWHLETRYMSPMLLNGAEKIAQPPTAKTVGELEALIKRHVRMNRLACRRR